MQMCPNCDKVYDESEYTHCPYCSGEIEPEAEKYKDCPECNGIMYWDGDCWSCSNCSHEIHTDEDDYDPFRLVIWEDAARELIDYFERSN